MKRRVVKHGPSTYIISLPSKWVKRFDVKKGDELDVDEDDNILTVTVDRRQEERVVELDITNWYKLHIRKAIRSIYCAGADSLLLTFKKDKTRDKEPKEIIGIVHELVGSLIGFEVMEENETSCLIKDLQETSLRDFDQLMRRIFTLITNMTEYLVEASSKGALPSPTVVQDRYNTIKKFSIYCMRLLNRKDVKLPAKTNHYFYILSCLESIAHMLHDATQHCVLVCKTKDSPAAILFLGKLSEAMKTYREFYFNYDIHKAEKISELRTELLEMSHGFKDVNPQEMVVITILISVLFVIEELVDARMALEY